DRGAPFRDSRHSGLSSRHDGDRGRARRPGRPRIGGQHRGRGPHDSAQQPGPDLLPAAGYTKRDVVEYYLAVGDGIMRALADRPTTLQRFPQGVEAEMFFQKRVPARGAPLWLSTARITFPSGRSADQLCPTDLAHVVWAAQMGTIVFHPWPVRRSDVDRPDELRIDLDPQPGTDFADAADVAAEVRAVLAELGAVGYPKTS